VNVLLVFKVFCTTNQVHVSVLAKYV